MVWLGSPGGPRCLKEIVGSLPQPFPFLHSASLRTLGACPVVCVCGLGSPDPAKFRFTVFLLSGTLEDEVVALTPPLSPD